MMAKKTQAEWNLVEDAVRQCDEAAKARKSETARCPMCGCSVMPTKPAAVASTLDSAASVVESFDNGLGYQWT